MFPHSWDVLSLDDHIKHFGEKGYHFPGKISQDPIQKNVLTWRLTCLKLSNALETLVRLVRIGWQAKARAKDTMAFLNHATLSNFNDRTGKGWNWDSKLSARTLAFSKSDQAKLLVRAGWDLRSSWPTLSSSIKTGPLDLLECIRTISDPPLLELDTNEPLQVNDTILGSRVLINLAVSLCGSLACCLFRVDGNIALWMALVSTSIQRCLHQPHRQ